MTSTIIPTKDVAALLRKELRTTFPGVKFSVRCATGTAAAWINVTYDDGPTWLQVDAITRKFQGRSFNGQTDSYDEHVTTLVAGEVDQLPTEVRYSCARNYSPAGHLAAQRVIREDSSMRHLVICDEHGTLNGHHDLTDGRAEDFSAGGRGWAHPNLSAWSAVRFVLERVDLTPTPAHQ
ncbi:hypothetical protein NY542_00045 [Curtobacterium flaccumfaciens pv. betae]|uniref:LPD29 domain-containing protein n=1 Tax=Curtobacterium flaccumfaciens TaxID=2035 RepID=UPI001BDE695B|nr:LPD29 domain-containing protein [Curtobacterium flaccumfaciens]MBT1607898.1 hypothetical protein [Curtobacterium flaccumfaciens pv. betae]MBT1657449.1 hypothetical protein [Curtobacterium flaccumfaciens pv. betae]MCS5465592.1 hypothetical protein [Curtobacterium flaccumfaciens pv. betae]MCX2873653.1 hypothetical protein [Curtobacterium flaccumfaciens pv. betae]